MVVCEIRNEDALKRVAYPGFGFFGCGMWNVEWGTGNREWGVKSRMGQGEVLLNCYTTAHHHDTVYTEDTTPHLTDNKNNKALQIHIHILAPHLQSQPVTQTRASLIIYPQTMIRDRAYLAQ